MPKKFIEELKALAKKHGLQVSEGCCYCQETHFSDGGEEQNWMVTFTGKAEDED